MNDDVETEITHGRFCMLSVKIYRPHWNLNVLFYSCTVLKHHALVVSKIVARGFPHIFQMLAQFVIPLQKLSFMNSITGLMSQVYKYWKAVKLVVAFTSCYNIPCFFFFSSWKLVLSLATNVVSYFPSTLCSFSRKCRPNSQVWINTVRLFSQAKLVVYDRSR